MAKRIRDIALSRGGLIIVGQNDPEIADAVEWARSRGVAVVLLESPIDGIHDVPYIGIDNQSAGRTAGYFMKLLLKNVRGTVLTISHSGIYENHRQRISAFCECFSEDKTDVTLPLGIIGGDSNDATEEALKLSLSRFKDVAGIYNAGSAHRGVEKALRAHRKFSKVFYIGHDLSPDTRRLLQLGGMTLTIDQMPELQAQRSVEVLERLIGLRGGDLDMGAVPFHVITKENLTPEETDTSVHFA